MSKEIYISQSFIKSLYEYKRGDLCGLQFKAQYIDGVEFPSSDAMKLGQWFEYMCTGQTTKFGHIPEADRLKPKKATKKEIEAGKVVDVYGDVEDIRRVIEIDDVHYVEGALSKKYKDALEQVSAFKKMINHYGLEIVDTGVKLTDEKLKTKGDVDIVARFKRLGDDSPLLFIDTKFSGLIDNKWDDLGWADEALPYKDKIMIQAVHYKMLGKAMLGYEPDFYFWVFSSTNSIDRKNIKVVVDEDRFAEHENIIHSARAEFYKQDSAGWKPKPSPKKCSECPLNKTCEYSAEDIPEIQVVYYGAEI
jgi:hypothetical protein